MATPSNIRKVLKRNAYLLITIAWLVTLSFIIDNYWSSSGSPEAVRKNVSNYLRDQEIDFDRITNDTVFRRSVINKTCSQFYLEEMVKKEYGFFVFHRTSVIASNLEFWNTQIVDAPYDLLRLPNITGFIQLPNGYYVWRKNVFADYTMIALIPIKWNYAITNEYLKNRFVSNDKIENIYTITQNEAVNPVTSHDAIYLFSLEQKQFTTISTNNPAAIFLRLVALLMLFIFIHQISTFLVKKSFLKGVGFLIGTILIIRLASYYLPIPLNFRQFELFDPAIYGSNFILRSLGDLLINAFLFLWINLFVLYYIQAHRVYFSIKNIILKRAITFICLGFLIALTFLCGHVIRSMVADSQISFDVINFFTLNIYSVIGFITLGAMATGYFLFAQVVLYFLKNWLTKNQLYFLLSTAACGLVILSFRLTAASVLFELMLLLWLLLFLMVLRNRFFKLQLAGITSSGLIFWLFYFSVSISSIIIVENEKKELEKLKHYAETLSTKADPSSERLMNTVLTDFRNESLSILFDMFRQETSNKQLKDSLLNQNFTGYLNKYDTRIYTFDQIEQPLYNNDSTTFNTLSTILNTQGKPTAINDLYYYDISYDRFNYISKKVITDSAGALQGYLFILASPRRYKTDALYPELFLKGYDKSIENSPIYSYAVYNNLKMVSHHNDYAFPLEVKLNQIPKAGYEITRNNGYAELWYRAGSEKLVIISKSDSYYIEAITLFSYLFCTFLFVSGLFWLLNTIIRAKLRFSIFKTNWQMSIRNQVHGTILFISLLSFIVVGVATILFFINRYQSNNREKLSRIINVMQNEVRNSLIELSVFDDVVKVYDEGYKDKLELIITKISEVHAVDINLYDLDGNLRVSSLPLPYKKGIVSQKMDPVAYYHLHDLKQIQFFKQEKIGQLGYLSNYVPVIDESGRQYAYLNIPYFTAETKLRQEISNFLVTIINLNAFIFLIAGIVAFFITNRITSSFLFISNKMKEVNLGQLNEAIIWKRKDEIGELVQEYNKMVAKLDDSAAALAKSEREGAWREMARQVAHEIKNPLTPMKLSLQYLQKAIESNAENVVELSGKVAKTIVEQIDHLSHIAGEFSQFANIGNPNIELVDLHESLRTLVQLHNMEEGHSVHWKPLNVPVKILADKTQINRLFTNLIQNGFQSVPAYISATIHIKEVIVNNRIQIEIKDNGTGISPDVQSKIFTPNFTTKTSGTGLGLAMSKGIVEQLKGKIWFETEIGKGSSFYVEIPLA
ncbi:MAG: sensor histidine kinase [Ferruginibacter sp.]